MSLVRRSGRRSGRRRRDERGAVAVEAALVLPVLVMLVFGIVDVSFLVRDHVAASSATRAAGRMASANAGAGPADKAVATCISPCTPANAPKLAQLAANAVQTMGTALPTDSIKELWVYRADASGRPIGSTGSTMSCTTDCVRYTWVKASNEFRYSSGTWLSKNISACVNQAPDSVGVYLRASHASVTRLFPDIDVEDRAVFTFEPLPSLTCAAGKHL